MDLAQDPETQLQEQEKRIEISCALATEASRRGRMLSGKMKCSAALSEDQAMGHHSPNKSKAFASIDIVASAFKCSDIGQYSKINELEI